MLGRLEQDKARASRRQTSTSHRPPGRIFGIVLLEAMAAGAPIVCSDIHGYKGVVRRGQQALLVPPRDHAELAEAIGSLLDDPAHRARMGEAGRERAQQFSWPSITAKVDEYYGFVIRRLAAQGALPPDFRAEVPSAPRLVRQPDQGLIQSVADHPP
jgi:hypothetical protein